MARLSRAITCAGVPAGATMAKKPFMTMPGTVSRNVGKSGKFGNRFSDVTARRRTLPASTTALAAAIELIITWLMPLATSVVICAADR